MAAPDVVHVVAMGRNRVIGRDGGLPWHISGDLKYFKRVTLGKPIVMGRKTFESIGRPLPGRCNIVISRNPDYHPDGTLRAGSLAEALEAAKSAAARSKNTEICVIGGGEVFTESLEMAQRLYVTEVEAAPAGDTFFPEIDPDLWRETSRERCPAEATPPQSGSLDADAQETPAYSFVVYERR